MGLEYSVEQESKAGGDTFRVEMEYTTIVHDAQGAPFMTGTPRSANPVGSVSPTQSPIHDAVEEIGFQGVEFATPLALGDEDLDVDHDRCSSSVFTEWTTFSGRHHLKDGHRECWNKSCTLSV
jgi:hypothetical protein